MAEEQERGIVSWEAFLWLRREHARLQEANAQLEREVAFWQHQTNHWYMKANYSPREIEEFQRRLMAGESWPEVTKDTRDNC